MSAAAAEELPVSFASILQVLIQEPVPLALSNLIYWCPGGLQGETRRVLEIVLRDIGQRLERCSS